MFTIEVRAAKQQKPSGFNDICCIIEKILKKIIKIAIFFSPTQSTTSNTASKTVKQATSKNRQKKGTVTQSKENIHFLSQMAPSEESSMKMTVKAGSTPSSLRWDTLYILLNPRNSLRQCITGVTCTEF